MDIHEHMSRVLAFANKAHAGQMRRGGVEPYINHPIRVCKLLAEQCCIGNRDILTLAILHDVVEDTPYSFEDCNIFFNSQEGVEALRLITKMEGESSADALDRLVASGNRIALWVKAADAMENSVMCEAGEKFTREVLGKDPDVERTKYIEKAQACLSVLGKDIEVFTAGV